MTLKVELLSWFLRSLFLTLVSVSLCSFYQSICTHVRRSCFNLVVVCQAPLFSSCLYMFARIFEQAIFTTITFLPLSHSLYVFVCNGPRFFIFTVTMIPVYIITFCTALVVL